MADPRRPVRRSPAACRVAAVRVLVVDDEEEVRGVLARALERDGHVVSTAATAAEAGARLAEAEIVVLDLGLPDARFAGAVSRAFIGFFGCWDRN